MAKEQFSPEELEHIEGKEIPKTIHYHYICNQRTTGEELLLFIEKLLILFIFLIALTALSPHYFEFLIEVWKDFFTTNYFNGVAY